MAPTRLILALLTAAALSAGVACSSSDSTPSAHRPAWSCPVYWVFVSNALEDESKSTSYSAFDGPIQENIRKYWDAVNRRQSELRAAGNPKATIDPELLRPIRNKYSVELMKDAEARGICGKTYD